MSFCYSDFTSVIDQISILHQRRIPFLFALDFKKTKGFCIKIDEINPETVLFEFSRPHHIQKPQANSILSFTPPTFESYLNKFQIVQQHIQQGDTYLCNLTQPTPIDSRLDLKGLFKISRAPYKLWVQNEFLVFSPETFVIIENGHISTFPMKGTADASEASNLDKLMTDPKENAEHNTIVDLLRNDLSIVAQHVQVKKLKYIQQIQTDRGPLWQMSSEISGKIKNAYIHQVGQIFEQMLPAGSICGAPKLKTLEIIESVESYPRNFYTGIFGYFDGHRLESAVMIRFIENIDGNFFYKSGGGITSLSNPHSEYQELLRKIYVPIF